LRVEEPSLSPDEGFAAIVLPHLDAAHNLARWLMHDAAAAEDVLQEALLRALTYFSSFRGGNARAWLLQIVRNTAYGAIATERARPLVPIAADEEEAGAVAELRATGDDPETSLIRSREQGGVRALIAALPFELREVMVLRELEELSYKDIAEVTRTPIGTVMSRLWRARRSLVEAAAKQGLTP